MNIFYPPGTIFSPVRIIYAGLERARGHVSVKPKLNTMVNREKNPCFMLVIVG